MRLPGPPSDAENSSDSRTIAAKSATVAATIVVWPTSPSALPASLSTGTTRPSEVAESAMMTSTGLVIHPAASSPQPMRCAERERHEVAEQGDPQQSAVQPSRRRSPARTGTAGTPARSAPGSDWQVDLDPAEHRRAEHDARRRSRAPPRARRSRGSEAEKQRRQRPGEADRRRGCRRTRQAWRSLQLVEVRARTAPAGAARPR